MSSVSTKLTFCFSCLFSLLLALPTMAAEQKDWKRFRFEAGRWTGLADQKRCANSWKHRNGVFV
jgi:hypothetical protein